MFYKVNRNLKGTSYNAVKITDFLMIMFYACIQFPFNSSYPTGVLMLTSEIHTVFITHVVFLTCLIQPTNFRDRLVIPCVALHLY
jgi:hypothetical protein